MTPDAVAEARLADLVSVIGRDVPLKRGSGGWWGRCPFHAHGQERTPSLHVTPGRGWYCHACGEGGDAIAWVQRLRGLDFAAAIASLASVGLWPASSLRLSPQESHSPSSAPRGEGDFFNRNATLAASIWAESRPLTEPSPATLYLRTRGLWDGRVPLPEALRYHPRLWCGEVKRHLPALVAAVEDDSDLVAVQRIWLAERWETVGGEGPPDSRASGLQTRKKTLGHMGSGAVRLGSVAPSLGLAEGIESAMAAALLFQQPVWAVLGASRFERVALALPAEVGEVLLFADGDEAGLAAADKAMQALLAARDVAVMVVMPPNGFKDWNDMLVQRQ